MSSTHHSAPRQYDTPYQSVQQTELKIHPHALQETDSNHTESSFRSHQWDIGWVTPLIMVLAFLFATATAIGHYFYCWYLDRKFVGDTIPQSWNNAISMSFARVFSTALAASASTAFTQLLWWYLRRRPLPLSKIDALFSINSSPLNLYQLSLLKAVPLLWSLGLLIPLISVATIFPPGSLVVDQLPDSHTNSTMVPTLNVDNRGNGSAVEFFSHAMFTHGADGEYRWPDVRYSGIGKRTILEGSYLTRASPCGANCSYTLVFSAPSLRCQETTSNPDLEEQVFTYYSKENKLEGAASEWVADSAEFMAAPYQSGGQFLFDLSYQSRDTNNMAHMSCTTLDSTYTAYVKYMDWIQTMTVDVTEGQPLNASAIGRSNLFYDVMQSVPTETGFAYSDSTFYNFTTEELFDMYHGSQLRTIRDTLVRALSGAISAFGTEGYFTINTLIQETKLAYPVYKPEIYTFSDIFFDLSPSVVEDFMKNVTISMLNDSEDKISTVITASNYRSAYVFKDRIRLAGAYGGALIACLAFLLLGFGALLQNGTSASSGGFLQIMCTTTHGDGTMNKLAKGASLGGDVGVPMDLKNLNVRFGVVTGRASETRHAAFGTVEDTEPLVKGL